MSDKGADSHPIHQRILPANAVGPQSSSSGAASSANKKLGRNHITTACQSCRHRRVKCDGQKPTCSQCDKTNRHCVYPSRDRRTLRARQEDTEAFNTKLRALELVVERLRAGTDSEAAEALQNLRAADNAVWLESYHDSVEPARPSRQNSDGLSMGIATGKRNSAQSDSSVHNELPPSDIDESPRPRSAKHGVSLSDAELGSSIIHGELAESFSNSRDFNIQHAKRQKKPDVSNLRANPIIHRLLLSSHSQADVAHQAYRPISQDRDHAFSQSARANRVYQAVESPVQMTKRSDVGSVVVSPNANNIHSDQFMSYRNQFSTVLPQSVVESFGNLGIINAIFANGFPSDIQQRQALVLERPAWSTPSLTFYDDSPLAQLVENFRQVSLTHIASGKLVAEILGIQDSIDVELLFRNRDPDNRLDDLDVGNFACDVWRNVMGEQDIYVLMAMVAMNARLARWMLLPCSATWSQIPEMARPFPSQKLLPHNPTIDFCAHPYARQSLMNNYTDWITASELGKISVSWSEGSEEAVTLDPVTRRRVMTKKFEKHIADPENWTWTRDVLQIMPCIEDMGAAIRAS